ncbi:MAG: NUDIX hydrolase [Patescibacteria group bacterium]
MLKIIIASGPVIVENGKVLLNKHGDDNFWKFCGGKVEDYNTNLADNAKREVKEEMGIDIDVLDKKPYIMHITKETPDGDMDIILVHFLAKRIGEINPGADIREWNWFDISDLPKDLAPNIKPVLEHFKK